MVAGMRWTTSGSLVLSMTTDGELVIFRGDAKALRCPQTLHAGGVGGVGAPCARWQRHHRQGRRQPGLLDVLSSRKRATALLVRPTSGKNQQTARVYQPTPMGYPSNPQLSNSVSAVDLVACARAQRCRCRPCRTIVAGRGAGSAPRSAPQQPLPPRDSGQSGAQVVVGKGVISGTVVA